MRKPAPNRRMNDAVDRIGRGVKRGGKGISLAYTDFGNSSGGGGRADRPGRSGGGGGGGGGSPSYSTPNAILNSPGASPSASYPSAPSSPSTPIATAGPATAPAAAPAVGRPAAPAPVPGAAPTRSPAAAIRQGTVAGGEFLQRIIDAGASKQPTSKSNMEATINAIMEQGGKRPPATSTVNSIMGSGENPATGPIPTTVPPSNNTQDMRRVTTAAAGGAPKPTTGRMQKPQEQRPNAQVQRIMSNLQLPTEDAGLSRDAMLGLVKPSVRASRKTGIPASVILGLTGQESAYGTNQGPSSAGAQGVAQFIPSTREGFLARGVDPWKNKRQGTLAAGMYLSDLGFNEDPQGALSDYSGGYAEDDYNNPILSRAEQLKAVDRLVGKNLKGAGTGTTGPKMPKQKVLNNWLPATADDNLDLADPKLLRRVVKVAKESGDPIEVNSGVRTRAEQAALYAAYQNGTGNLAAPPGTSNHESGNALDLNMTDEQRALLGQYGLGLPVPGENWHVELTKDTGYNASSGGGPVSSALSSGATTSGPVSSALATGGSSYAAPTSIPMGTSSRPTTRPSSGTGAGYTSPIAARPVMPGGGSTTNSALASALGGQQRSSRSDRDLEELLASLSPEELEELGLA